MFNRKLAIAAAIGLFLGLSASNANATDQDVDALLQTRAAISLTKNSDMDFGIIDYATTHGGTIDLGTNGTITLSGATGLTASGTPAAGDVDASGDGASTVDVSCETSGTLTDGGANSLTVSAVEITDGAGGALGTGTACAGLGTASISIDLSVTANPTILMGAQIDVSGNAISTSANYSTANAGGNPVTLRVVYQ